MREFLLRNIQQWASIHLSQPSCCSITRTCMLVYSVPSLPAYCSFLTVKHCKKNTNNVINLNYQTYKTCAHYVSQCRLKGQKAWMTIEPCTDRNDFVHQWFRWIKLYWSFESPVIKDCEERPDWLELPVLMVNNSCWQHLEEHAVRVCFDCPNKGKKVLLTQTSLLLLP